jgi:hypothetical protein
LLKAWADAIVAASRTIGGKPVWQAEILWPTVQLVLRVKGLLVVGAPPNLSVTRQLRVLNV